MFGEYCPECGHLLSTNRNMCPFCGYDEDSDQNIYSLKVENNLSNLDSEEKCQDQLLRA